MKLQAGAVRTHVGSDFTCKVLACFLHHIEVASGGGGLAVIMPDGIRYVHRLVTGVAAPSEEERHMVVAHRPIQDLLLHRVPKGLHSGTKQSQLCVLPSNNSILTAVSYINQWHCASSNISSGECSIPQHAEV